MAKQQKKVKIRDLKVGAVFGFTAVTPDGGSVFQQWKIIGRPTYSGQRLEGKKEFIVPCIYVKLGKEDQNIQPDKSFPVNYEVSLVRPGQKDFQAIDQRDQPKDGKGGPAVSPIGELAKEVGVGDEEEDDDTIDSLIKDDEDEETENGD